MTGPVWSALLFTALSIAVAAWGFSLLYSWIHEGRRSLWKDSAEAIGWAWTETFSRRSNDR